MIADLKPKASELSRTVEVERLPEVLDEILLDVGIDFHTFDIVRRGRVVAQIVPPPLKTRITPLDQVGKRPVSVTPEERQRLTERWNELVARLGAASSEPFDAVEAIREQRREL